MNCPELEQFIGLDESQTTAIDEAQPGKGD